MGEKTRKIGGGEGKKNLIFPPTWNLMLPSFLLNSKLATSNVKFPTHCKKKEQGEY
jgi:hypothetical protein